MPSKERDREASEADERPKERRRDSKSERRGDGEREHRHRHKSSRSSRTKVADSDVQSSSHRRRRTKEERDRDRDNDRDRERPASPVSEMADVVPELNRSKERVNVPYPSFSKAHSKENIHSREDVSVAPGRRTDPLTPEPTDVGPEEMKRSKSADYSGGRKPSTRARSNTRTDGRPPSPPDTSLSGPKDQRTGTPSSTRRREKDPVEERPRSRTSWFSRPGSRQDEKSKLSTKSKTSSQATYVMTPATRAPYVETAAEEDSSVGGRRSAPRRRGSGQGAKPDPIEIVDLSPESAQDSSPRTPTQTPQFPPHILPNDKQAAPAMPFSDAAFRSQTQTPATDFGSGPPPPPPPPPPPTLNIQEAPRVDYLMQHGGLPSLVPRNFLAVLPRQNGTRPSNPPLQGPQTLFAPFFNLLDQYNSVLSNHGSIAVATGHRTVARRLLDRLENVFSRDLPAEGCSCVVCERSDGPHRGLGWGEVLERVSGRIEIPSWPPFDFADVAHKSVEAVELPRRPASPVKMDPDIAEELREHYLRQNKRTRASVDTWMANCAQAPAPPPQEIDDETLTFAVLTTLDQQDRPFFIALLTGSRELQPALRAPTPMRKPRQDFVVRSGLAIQRLYRLFAAPRDAETILFLIKNRHMHDLLHTISDINPSEWEILISGRFDGFLWSGADDDVPTPIADGPSRGATPASGFFPPGGPPSRGPTMSPGPRLFSPMGGIGTSRSTTPFSAAWSRGTTPASFVSGTSVAGGSPRAAVSHDEETEVAALAELEREIYVGMEALEDAFETLHQRAETVRTALRQRGAGLAMALQQRRGGSARSIDVLPQSGGSGAPGWAGGAGGGVSTDDEASDFDASDWGGDEFDILPEDSASNISSSKRRRPIRRNERRTPAPIEEEDE